MLKFVWNDTDIGHYRCKLYRDDEILVEISLIDYTDPHRQAYDKKYKIYRANAFEMRCPGMRHTFDYDNEYSNRIDEETGEPIYGYNGHCTHSIEDAKRWCEEYLAQLYIDDYNNMIKKLDPIKELRDWFIQNGYGKIDLENF